jgi:predicted O-methyltransferase YrrM
MLNIKQSLNRLLRNFAIKDGNFGERYKSANRFTNTSNFSRYIKKTEGMITFEEANLLYELARRISDNSILEIGSYRGRSTVALGCGSLDGSQVPVFAIEPHEDFIGVLGAEFGPEDRAAFYKAMLDTGCYKIVRLVNLSSDFVAPQWQSKISLLFIDGDHAFTAVKKDFECWYPHLIKGALIAFHDSKDPQIGPFRLIRELLKTGKFEKKYEVGEITILELKSSIV